MELRKVWDSLEQHSNLLHSGVLVPAKGKKIKHGNILTMVDNFINLLQVDIDKWTMTLIMRSMGKF